MRWLAYPQTAAVTANGLKLSSQGNVNLSNAGNNIKQLAAVMTSGSLTLVNQIPVDITTVAGTSGINFDGNPNPVSITSVEGSITVSQPISSVVLGGANVSLNAGEAVIVNAPITSTFNATLTGMCH